MTFFAYARGGPHRYLECFGLDFEEFAAGQRFLHRPGVTVSQQDNADVGEAARPHPHAGHVEPHLRTVFGYLGAIDEGSQATQQGHPQRHAVRHPTPAFL